ncbi:MAG: orotate phosphoribosyltransferase [Planctomycetota bacterium]
MKTFDVDAARKRLCELVRERAFRDGLDIVLSSGKRSDFYINGKRVTLDPEGLWLLARLMLVELEAFPDVTAVGGLTLGADPMAAAISALSYETQRPLRAFLVRKEAKGHGTGSRIEGELSAGDKVAILEDTVTTGASARRAIEAVLEVGAVPAVLLALADREDSDADELRRELPFVPLVRLRDLRGGR